jgi:pSer/pThr/pTyr-binding forkhead associated (FHA) protein
MFGTEPDCDVRVDDPFVSNHHCAITETDDGRVLIEDLGSTNGTWVRPASQVAVGKFSLPGVKVYGPTEIQPGWIVRIGKTDLPWRDATAAV